MALKDPAHELFAQERAGGATLEEAYAAAGYAPDRSHASRLGRHPEMIARIAEIKEERAAEVANYGELVACLNRIVARCEEQKTPAALKEARLTLIEIRRLTRERDFARYCEQRNMLGHFFNTLK